ncbi:MAG TPA: hypothetical protein VGP25_01115, partial [Gemmatimonadaceae bacterium]|nr:hypothetical protein [Gemmatimonadaceae bacterium]
MASLKYRAVTRAGVREAGTIDAATADAATESLRARGLIVLDVAPATSNGGGFGKRVRSGDLAEFTRALAALLPAGLPLPKALGVTRDIA